MEKRKFARSRGKASEMTAVIAKPTTPRIKRAVTVSFIMCWSFEWSFFAFTISFVAESKKPKSTKICM